MNVYGEHDAPHLGGLGKHKSNVAGQDVAPSIPSSLSFPARFSPVLSPATNT
jgi:hypothetical protein